jgi:hypothetical protein
MVTLPVKLVGTFTHIPTLTLPVPDAVSDADELVIVSIMASPSKSIHEVMM